MNKKNKRIILYIVGILLFLSFFTSLLNNTIAQSDFSENLQNENYTPETTINSGWFDAYQTFWYDVGGTFPKEWKDDDICVSQITSIGGHTNCLYMYDNAGGHIDVKYYFPTQQINFTNTDFIHFSYWAYCIYNNRYVSNHFAISTYGLQTPAGFIIKFKDNAWVEYIDMHGSFNLGTYAVNTWMYITIELYLVDYEWNIYVKVEGLTFGGGTYDDYFLDKSDLDNRYVDFFNIKDSQDDNRIYIDALNTYSEIDGVSYSNLQSEILGQDTNKVNNKIQLDSNKVFSLYNSIISEKADIDNNYRSFFINDIFISDNLIDKNRLLRLKGSSDIDKKYKVIQLYFDNLDNPNAFTNDLNQSIRIRFDTFDNSNNLINKFFIYLDFSNTEGFLYWNWYIRESLAIPRWLFNYHNPTFSFQDYLCGQTLKSMEITFNVFLTKNSSEMLFFIRTNIAFNHNYSMIYSYDKVINAGSLSGFYANQDEVRVKYIDYFNKNYAIDYLGNTYYRYNCLAGIRHLQVNDTSFYYNFLDVGYFSDMLYYYTPPPPPPEPPEPPELEPEQPEGFDYYQSYTAYILTIETIEITVGNWSYNFTLLHSSPITVKFWFNYDTVSYIDSNDLAKSWGDWGINNWLRNALALVIAVLGNIFIFILNMGLWACQYILFGLVITFQFLCMYIVLGLVFCELIWNIAFRWIFQGIIALGWIIYYGMIWLFYVGLDGLVLFLVSIIAWLLALFVWFFLTLCTGNFNDIYTIIFNSLSQIALFVVDLFQVIALNMITFLLFVEIYTVLTLLILYKQAISKAKGNLNRSNSLHEAYEFFVNPLRALWNLIVKIKNLIIGWM